MTCSEDGRLGILLSHGGINHTRHGGSDGSGIVAQLGVQRRVGELDRVALLPGLEQLHVLCGMLGKEDYFGDSLCRTEGESLTEYTRPDAGVMNCELNPPIP